MGTNEINWILDFVRDEYDLENSQEQEMLITYLSLADDDTVTALLNPLISTIRSEEELDQFAVRLARGLLSYRGGNLSNSDRESFIQTLLSLLSDPERIPARITIYQLTR